MGIMVVSNNPFSKIPGSQLRAIAGAFQQTTSSVSITDQDCYEKGGGCFSIYGFEYKPG
jgi:hypothetical protein